MYKYNYNCILGDLCILADDEYICEIKFEDNEKNKDIIYNKSKPIINCINQLEEYFAGKRKVFDLPLKPVGTNFQLKVWEELTKIPYGKIATYQEIAEKAGSPKACRAVGMTNHNNPIAIVIPCHRVIGKNKKLVGYAGGLDKKEQLLKLEGVI